MRERRAETNPQRQRNNFGHEKNGFQQEISPQTNIAGPFISLEKNSLRGSEPTAIGTGGDTSQATERGRRAFIVREGFRDHPNWLIGDSEAQERYYHKFPHSDFLWHPDKFVPTTREHYATWLMGYLAQGGHISTVLDEKKAEKWLQRAVTTTEDVTLGGECGVYQEIRKVSLRYTKGAFFFGREIFLTPHTRKVFVLPGRNVQGAQGENNVYLLETGKQIDFSDQSIKDTSSPDVPLFLTPAFGQIPQVKSEIERLFSEEMEAGARLREKGCEAPLTPTAIIAKYDTYAAKLGFTLESTVVEEALARKDAIGKKSAIVHQSKESQGVSHWILGDTQAQNAYREKYPHSDILNHPEKFEKADVATYTKWLQGYLEKGGRFSSIISEYTARHLLSNTLVATENFRLDGEKAEWIRPIIVEEGVQVSGKGEMLFFCDGYREVNIVDGETEEVDFVSLYAIPEVGAVPGVKEELQRMFLQALQTAHVQKIDTTSVVSKFKKHAEKLGIPFSDKKIKSLLQQASKKNVLA